MEWRVVAEESGVKLIDFLRKRLPSHSAKQIKRIIEQNGCQINGRLERFASTVLGRGDQVFFTQFEKETDEAIILYEDSSFIFCNKPSGIASEDIKIPGKLVHRLDKDTTGVLLFAKSEKLFETMVQLFREKKVIKEYLALVDGQVKEAGVIENQLGKISSYQGQTLWGAVENGLYARTEWQVEKAGRDATLLRCFPITGRTHQLRVHLSSIGHPILGDGQYGRKFRSQIRPKRCLLHAEKLSFEHQGKTLTILSPLPKDFAEALKQL